MFWIQRAGAMGIDFCLRHQFENCVIGQGDNFVDFVGGTETIEEMNKWDAAFQRSYLRNESKVLRFLNVCGAEHGTTGLTHSHHVRMIAKNGERMSSNGTCRNMQYKRR